MTAKASVFRSTKRQDNLEVSDPRALETRGQDKQPHKRTCPWSVESQWLSRLSASKSPTEASGQLGRTDSRTQNPTDGPK